MTPRRSIRTLRVEAEAALIEKRVFKVMAAKDWELLIKIAEIAQSDADVRLAHTDPSRFMLLRNGVSSWHLKGLTGVTPDSIRKALKKHQIIYLDPADRAAKPFADAERIVPRTPPAQPREG